MRLLIAEDELWLRKRLVSTIDWSSYGISEVYEAEDGGEALEIALKEKPDIVITDIRMPELSGIDLMKKLNENSIFSKMIVVSGYDDANAFFLAEIDGVKATLEKGGIDAEVIAPDPANDINTQVEDITQMVARGVDVIFVDALDKDGIKPALQEAERASIPVIAIDSNVEDERNIINGG